MAKKKKFGGKVYTYKGHINNKTNATKHANHLRKKWGFDVRIQKDPIISTYGSGKKKQTYNYAIWWRKKNK